MTKPVRVQLSRRKGWRMPENTVKVDRSTKWGNPFRVEDDYTVEEAIAQFRRGLRGASARGMLWTSWAQRILDDLPQLRGKNLACWCSLDQPCHADVLLELANGDPT